MQSVRNTGLILTKNKQKTVTVLKLPGIKMSQKILSLFHVRTDGQRERF
jgi:hypothetical protein